MSRTPEICPERAVLITESYKETEGEPMEIRRGKALDKILSNMTIYIEENQLIVGNQARVGRAAPIFPEYSIDWVIEELDEFDKRTGDLFNIDEETKEKLKEIHSYWTGRTHQDEMEATMSELNILAAEQKVIHRGGISMSAHGHMIPNYHKIMRIGYKGFLQEIEDAKSKLVDEDSEKEKKLAFYEGAKLSLEAVIKFSHRYSKLAQNMANKEDNPMKRARLEKISKVCKTVPENPPKNLHEAIQTAYFTHLILHIETNGHSFSFGRFDQYIYPFYKKDIEAGNITRDDAIELMGLFFVKLNSLNKVRPWGHTKYGAGYPLYQNLTVGGMKANGNDGTNELSYICIEAMDIVRLPQPNFSARYWRETPKEFLEASAKLIRKGFGMPAMYVDETIIKSLQYIGIDEVVARDYAPMGCVEVIIPGKWGHRATGMSYMNFAKMLLILLNNGVDPDTGIQIMSINGREGKEVEFETYEDLYKGWEKVLKFYSDLAVESDYICDKSLKKYDIDPFASCLTDNCIERGKILKEGGAEYDFISNSPVGINTVADSLSAIKKLVYDDKIISLEEYKEAIDSNWEGKKGQYIRNLALKAPKFGNDDDYADNISKDLFNSYLKLLPEYKNERYGKGPFGCGYTMSTSNISSNVPYGMEVGATPDGRYAREPLNEGASPTNMAGKEGPTGIIKSMSKLPNDKITGGQLLNEEIA